MGKIYHLYTFQNRVKVFGSVDSTEMIDEDAFEINGLVDMFFHSKFVDTNQC